MTLVDGDRSGVFPALPPQLISPALIRHLIHRSVDAKGEIDAVDQGHDGLIVANFRHFRGVWMLPCRSAPQAIERRAILST